MAYKMATDLQLEALQNMNDALTNKDSFYLTFTANKSVFTHRFESPIKLLPNRSYRAALHNFTTSNYLINIDETNNRFYYQWDRSPQVLTFEKGAYEISDINNEIIRAMKERKHWDIVNEKEQTFNLSLKLTTFKSVIEIKSDKLLIDFSQAKTFRHLLGFKAKTIGKGYNISDDTVQITSASSILIKCNITGGSYHNGKPSTVLYSVPAYLVPIGYKINIIPPTMIYLPVTHSVINQITFEITDDEDKVLDFKDEKMALAIHIEQV